MEPYEQIAERNNRDLIDYVYVPFLMRAGITVVVQSKESTAILSRASEILDENPGTEIVYPEDRILSQPPDSDSWNDIRRNVLFRTRVAAVGQTLGQSIISDGIAKAVAAELADDT